MITLLFEYCEIDDHMNEISIWSMLSCMQFHS